MRRLMRRAGPCLLQPDRRSSPYQALVSAIAHQQLTGAAARTILARLYALGGGKSCPAPEALLALPVEALRGAGFSAAKVLALRDIAGRALDGGLPPRRVLQRWDDERIVDQLVQIRGVGRWTVQMLLIFTLGRPDVLPVDDYGVRNGFRIAYGLDRLPTPRELGEHGLRWAPERSKAAWYLWRAVDLARAAG
ncbi:MAG: DNA-3-methyladenine glycosylase family protein [Steroidobacteraceae bacterium]